MTNDRLRRLVMGAALGVVLAGALRALVPLVVEAAVGLAGEARLLFEALAEAVGASPGELATVLILGAVLIRLANWTPKKRGGGRGRR